MDHFIRHINVTAKDSILNSIVSHSKQYPLLPIEKSGQAVSL
jgi:hypothetical protein